MWWCCGKSNKDAPGCKFSKHETYHDEDEQDVNFRDPEAVEK